MAEQDERCVAEYTEQDRANEGCCWTWQRDQCPGVGCRCVCHMSGEPVRTTYFDLVKEIEGYRQRSRDEDTARIRLNHARIDAEERAAKAEAERDAQRAIMDAQASVSEQHRKRVQEVAAERDALASRLAAAEAALREIEDVSCWQPRYLEWKRSAQKVGLCPSSDLAVNEIKHLARQALAALAGSREPATTTISDSGDSSRLSE